MALLSAFVHQGVRDFVVAPGSRSQALALAAAELERVGAIRLHVRIDERGAAFLALGTAIESGRPAVVVTTSGTAVANLHPAVLEAHHAGVPLIVCSADRPAELRGIRSNQTTMQPGIFAGAVRLERDVAAPEGAPGEADAAARLAREAVDAALGRDAAGDPVPHPGPGPVHLNLQFREPLSAVLTLDVAAARGPACSRRVSLRPPLIDVAAGAAVIEHGPRTVVVAGAGAGPVAEEFAREGDWPLIAEVTSGAHFGPNLVVAYRELLREPGFGDAVERVVVFGHPTLSREVPALVQREGVDTIAVAPTGIEWYNPGRRVAPLRAGGSRRRARGVGRRARVDAPLGSGEPHARRRGAARGGIRPQRCRRDRTRLGLRRAARVHAPAARRRCERPSRGGCSSTRSGRRRGRTTDSSSARHDSSATPIAQFPAGTSPRTRTAASPASTAPWARRSASRSRASRRFRARHCSRMPRRPPRVSRRPLRASSTRGEVAAALGFGSPLRGSSTLTDMAAIEGPETPLLDSATRTDAALAAVGLGTPLRGSSTRTGVTRALIGDLTLLHDVGSLLLGAGEPRPRLQLIVGNDGGGTIFDALEVAGSAAPDAFDRVQFTPQHVDLATLAAAYGWDYARGATRGELEEALTARIDGPQIVEVPLRR